MCMTRRALLGALATSAATPLVAGVPLEAAKKDEIGEHILREAQRLGQNLQDGVRRRETITALAANFRLHAAHVRSTGIEVTVSQAVGRQVLKRGGRSGLIESSKSPQAMQRHHDQLQALGLEGLHVPERESTDAELDRAVTALMTPGALSGALDRMAAQFDQLAEQVAAAGRGDARIVRVQDIGGWCSTMRTICEMMKVMVSIICALSAAGLPELAPICALLGVEVATACFLAWWGGC